MMQHDRISGASAQDLKILMFIVILILHIISLIFFKHLQASLSFSHRQVTLVGRPSMLDCWTMLDHGECWTVGLPFPNGFPTGSLPTESQVRAFDNASCPDELLEPPWTQPTGLVTTPVGRAQPRPKVAKQSGCTIYIHFISIDVLFSLFLKYGNSTHPIDRLICRLIWDNLLVAKWRGLNAHVGLG